MRAYVTDSGGTRWALPDLTAWRLEHTAGVPCDSFWLRCLWDGDSPSRPAGWVSFTAEEGGERVFTGLVDECEASISTSGRRMEVSGRGMAARLLDNEAMCQDYLYATQADILRDHVAPYGIAVVPGAALPPVEQFSVAAGSSEWSVVYDFARYYGGASPRFDRQGRLVLSGWEDGPVRAIGDKTNVIAMVHRDKRYGVLSQVLVRDRQTGQVGSVANTDFWAMGGRARKIVSMPARSNYKAMRYTAQFQLDKSASELERLEVTLGEVFQAWPGDLVDIQRTGWDWNGRYRVVQAINGMDEGGLWSRLELAEPGSTV